FEHEGKAPAGGVLGDRELDAFEEQVPVALQVQRPAPRDNHADPDGRRRLRPPLCGGRVRTARRRTLHLAGPGPTTLDDEAGCCQEIMLSIVHSGTASFGFLTDARQQTRDAHQKKGTGPAGDTSSGHDPASRVRLSPPPPGRQRRHLPSRPPPVWPLPPQPLPLRLPPSRPRAPAPRRGPPP